MCKLRNKIKENESPILVTLSLKFVTLSLLILHAVQKLILLFLLCSSLFFTQILPKLIYSPHNFTILTEWCAIGVQWRSVMGVVMRH